MKTLFVVISTVIILYGNELPKLEQAPPEINFKIINSGDAKHYSWEDFKNRVVVLDFWATWCAPCIEAFPHINTLVAEFPDSIVTFISLTYEPKHMLDPFFKKWKLNSQIAIDNDFSTFKSFNAWGIPLVVIVNNESIVAAVIHPTYLTKELIQDVLDGKIPKVEPAKAWDDPAGAEEYFRSLINKKNE